MFYEQPGKMPEYYFVGFCRKNEPRFLTGRRVRRQTKFMAHIYLTFDFGNDEERRQQARHKLESWKQAFRLDKKMLFKFDRKEDGMPAAAAPAEAAEKEKPAKAATAKGAKAAKGKSKRTPDQPNGFFQGGHQLFFRLALPNHEKLTEQRLLGVFRRRAI